MKQLMKRKIELILIFVLAAAIVAVSCLGPGSEPVTYVPQKMPDELAAEIEKAWYLKEYEHIDLDDSFYRYYGTYGDCVVYFESGPQGESETKWIAWRKFTYRYSFEIRVYCNGEFSTLEEAYADGLLSRKQVSLIADCHKQAESMASVTDGAAVKNDVPDRYPGTVSEEFAELWQEVQKA